MAKQPAPQTPRPAVPKQDQVKITLGDYSEDVASLAEKYNMKIATFCAYCAKYFVDHYDGKSLPPLKQRSERRQMNLDLGE